MTEDLITLQRRHGDLKDSITLYLNGQPEWAAEAKTRIILRSIQLIIDLLFYIVLKINRLP